MMSSYSSSSALRVLVAAMQVSGCFVYVCPAPSRPSSSNRKGPKSKPRVGPSPALCVWNAAVTVCLLAWLGFALYFETNTNEFLCVGKLAHLIAILLNITAVVLLPVLLLARSKLLSEVLSGLEDIPHPHGPLCLSRVSQVLHGVMCVVTFGGICWTHAVADGPGGLWKPILVFLNMFVIARVFLLTTLFRFLFHSLASEVVHTTQMVVEEQGHIDDLTATTQHDLNTANNHEDSGRLCRCPSNSTVGVRVTDDFTATTRYDPNDLNGHSHDLGESRRLSKYKGASKVDSEVKEFIATTQYDPNTANDHNYDYEGSKHVSKYGVVSKGDLEAGDDLTATTQHNDDANDHSHDHQESKHFYENQRNAEGDSKVDVTFPAKKVDGEIISRWEDARHLNGSSRAPGDHGEGLLRALAMLEKKVHVVDGLVHGSAAYFCEPMVVLFVCFAISGITGTFFLYLEGWKAVSMIIYVMLSHLYILRLCFVGQIFSDQVWEAIRLLRGLSSRSDDQRVKDSVERLVSYLATLSPLNLKGWCTLNLATLGSVLSSMATYLVILLQVGGQRVDLAHDHE